MQTDELSNVLSIIYACRSPNNDTRIHGEEQLLYCYHNHPNKIVQYFLFLICMNRDQAVQVLPTSQQNLEKELQLLKSYICVQLQNLLIKKQGYSAYPFIWPQLDLQVKEEIKRDLLYILSQQTFNSQVIIGRIANLTGSLGAQLNGKHQIQWPQFFSTALDFFSSSNKRLLTRAFILSGRFFEEQTANNPEIFPQIQSLFEKHLQEEHNLSLLLSVLHCFSSYLAVVKEQADKGDYLNCLVPHVIKAIHVYHSRSSKCQHHCVLLLLKIMLETHPNFFRKQFNLILQYLQQLLSQRLDQQHKDLINQTLVDYCKQCPSVFQRNKQNLEILLKLVISYMFVQYLQITQEWKCPPEGFDLEQTAIPLERNNKIALTNLVFVIRSVGHEIVLNPILEIIQMLFSKEEQQQQCHYYGLMLLSQLGQCFQSANQAKKYIPIVIQALRHQNPMLRYAALHVLGQFADDLGLSFCKILGQQTYEMLIVMLDIEQVPRVTEHILAALINILEGMKFVSIASSFQNVLKNILHLARTGITIVRQSAYVAISSFAQIITINFIPFLDQYFSIFCDLFHNQQYSGPQYCRLKGHSLQTMCYIIASVGPQPVRCYLSNMIQILIKSDEAFHKPPFRRILNLWRQICLSYKEEIESVLMNFIPSLLEKITNNIDEAIRSWNLLLKEQESKMGADNYGLDDYQPLQFYQTQEVMTQIVTIDTFCGCLPRAMSNYYQSTLKIYLNILQNFPNVQIQDKAIMHLAQYLLNISDTNQQIIRAKHFLSLIMLLIEPKDSINTTPQKFKGIGSIFETLNMKIFPKQELLVFTDKLLTQFDASDERVFKLMKHSPDQYQNEAAQIKADIQVEQDIQEHIIDILGTVLKIYGCQLLDIAQMLVDNMIGHLLSKPNQSNRIKAGLYVLDDVIQYMSYQCFPKHWNTFLDLLLQFVGHRVASVRQAASYGIGIHALQTPIEMRSQQLAKKTLDSLKNAALIPKGQGEKKRYYFSSRDNIISAMGKVIISNLDMPNIQEYIEQWLTYMPLKYDILQSQEQTQYLVYLINYKTDLLFDRNGSQLQIVIKLLKILSEILVCNRWNHNIKEELKDSIRKLQSFEGYTLDEVTIRDKVGWQYFRYIEAILDG